jgi:hypothetical protein
MSVSINDPRYLSGELLHIKKGTVTVKDNKEKYYNVSINDPRIKSGELINSMNNMVPVRDRNGKCFFVPIDDKRYINKELVHNCKGLKKSEEHKKNISISIRNRLKTPMDHSHFGKMWINNGKENKMIKKETPIPNGFIRGRKPKISNL